MPTCAPSWPWPLITNGILPARFSTHIRSSTARVTAISRYISSRSSRERPRSAPSAVALSAALDGVRVAAIVLLKVDRLAVDCEGGFVECLRECWVRMNGGPYFPGRRLEQHRHTGLADQVGHVWSDHMDTEQLVGLLVRDDLHEAFVVA